jgi:hypothetical protein
MTRAEALKRGLPVLGIFRSFAAVGVDPAVMGIGPAVAIPEACRLAGLSVDDIDLFELNEAFASQASFFFFFFCRREMSKKITSCAILFSERFRAWNNNTACAPC